MPAPGAGLCHGSEAWELRARGRRELGQEPSRGCLEPPALLGAALQGRIWQGSQRKAAGSARAHSALPLRGGGGKPGWGEGGFLHPAPIADWPGLRELASEGNIAGGIRAASSPGVAGTEWEPPGRLARLGEPAWFATLCFPSPVLGCLCPTPDGRWARGRRKRPQSRAMRAALSPARLVREWGGRALRQVGRVLGANFGVPQLSAPLGPGSSAMGITNGAPRAPWSPPAFGPPMPASALPCCGAPAAVAGAVPQGRAAAGAGSPASGARRVAWPGCRSPPG